ncbi:hypothetical protein FIV42_16570 [Persicimonas caeni]|uniref:SPW repeat-containing protein n=1 Tax=Persicimonas caeni TaxID=2292766 RepID=A0A4Y6PVD7_PERCE|nr:hypothetical protein [Persicimonas caeni]QDG52292.1 hypothetical protein FIV42_16570 [Persicimonas caeni]QED33514.1 hypothetical protein FRD00_16565 [Persicimonas caeni]
MNWKRWDVHHRRWQDILAFVAGCWLIATVMAQISTVMAPVGWMAFIGGALAFLMTAAALQDDSPGYSWAAAAGGLIAVGGAFIALAFGHMFTFLSLVIGGGVVLLLEVWSAALKRRAHEPSRRRVGTARPVRT